MESRISESVITFSHRFSVGATVTDQPAGSYRLSKEERLVEGVSFPVFFLVSLSLELPAVDTPASTTQFFPVTMRDVEDSLRLDAEIADHPNLTKPFGTTSMASRAQNFGKQIDQTINWVRQ
jgi:hypothetical protein